MKIKLTSRKFNIPKSTESESLQETVQILGDTLKMLTPDNWEECDYTNELIIIESDEVVFCKESKKGHTQVRLKDSIQFIVEESVNDIYNMMK